MSKVLIVDDKQMMRDSVAATLTRAGFGAVAADGGEAALEALPRHRPAAVVTDLKMPGMDGIELLKRVRAFDPGLPVILMTAYATVETAVRALKDGAYDYIQKPFEGEALVAAVRRAAEHRRLRTENEALRQTGGDTRPRALVGGSAAMRRVHEQIERIAASHGTVLVSGESGTGKELVARAVHAMSQRRERVMLCLNCAALSGGLLESELFGHEKGAFTGADRLRRGRFELADGGTLLLDEVSEIPPNLQAKLLRVLQEKQFERVGSSATIGVDARVIATTNRDLGASVAEGDFRRDLFYRLNVLPIHLPPLRARREDIAPLAEHFLDAQAARDGREPKRFDAEAVRLLRGYGWPGNVRELENICERAAVLTPGAVIEAETIRPWLSTRGPAGTGWDRIEEEIEPEPAGPDALPSIPPAEGATLEQMERDVIIRTLDRYDGHRRRTASALGIGVRTLGLKLKKWKEQNLVADSV